MFLLADERVGVLAEPVEYVPVLVSRPTMPYQYSSSVSSSVEVQRTTILSPFAGA